MLRKESREVVGHHGVGFNGRIQAALARARLQYIPQCDARLCERGQPIFIWRSRRKAAQQSHDFPEAVAGVRVVLLRLQRTLAGHAAQDQHPCAGIGDKTEA